MAMQDVWENYIFNVTIISIIENDFMLFNILVHLTNGKTLGWTWPERVQGQEGLQDSFSQYNVLSKEFPLQRVWCGWGARMPVNSQTLTEIQGGKIINN